MPHMHVLSLKDKYHRDLLIGESCVAIIEGRAENAVIVAAKMSQCLVKTEKGEKHVVPWSKIINVKRSC
tara:strand:+ start:86 stop:292 length:207 start_codon:yes stop_codon:yes gene_type:complete